MRLVLATEPRPGTAFGGHCFAVADGAVRLRQTKPDDHHPLYLGTLDGTPCWAVEATDTDQPACVPLRPLHAQVDPPTWAMAGRAVQLIEWARTTRFCGRCGTPTEPAPHERAARCPSCHLLAFPRLAPAVIVLVERDGTALLARSHHFAPGVHSCLAGFVEPGETLEEAVHREVAEEAGIPWPTCATGAASRGRSRTR